MSNTARRQKMPKALQAELHARVASAKSLGYAATAGARQFRVITGDATKREQKKMVLPMLCGVLAVAFIALQIGLANITSQGAYELTSLKSEQRDTVRVERVLAQNAMSLNSPQNLVDNAKELGMVQNSASTYLRLSDGAVIGAGTQGSEQAVTNLVANSTLAALPVVNAEGTEVARSTPATTTAAEKPEEINPVSWNGELPAPNTH